MRGRERVKERDDLICCVHYILICIDIVLLKELSTCFLRLKIQNEVCCCLSSLCQSYFSVLLCLAVTLRRLCYCYSKYFVPLLSAVSIPDDLTVWPLGATCVHSEMMLSPSSSPPPPAVEGTTQKRATGPQPPVDQQQRQRNEALQQAECCR